MLHRTNITNSAIQESSIVNRKTISFNGCPAIEYLTLSDFLHTTFYSEENRLLIILNGAINLIYGKLEHAMNKNQIAFLRNNTVIECQNMAHPGEHNKTELAIFQIDYGLMKEFSKATQLSFCPGMDTNATIVNNLHPNLLKFMDSLAPYFDDAPEMDEALIKIKLLELLFSLKHYDSAMLDLLLDFKKDTRPNITAFMEDNFMNPLSLNQLARLAGRSLSSFRRDFLSTYNMPPSQWIRKRRLKKAREFLLTTNMTITDICYTLGFENAAHFSRIFKSQFGHPPSEYRVYLMSA